MNYTTKRFRIGIDTGGTFVDAVELNEETGVFKFAKSPTTPSDPSIGVLQTIEKLGTPLNQTYMIIHGTTLGVNAIVQGKGARTGILTNDGFRDIFEIGRGDVPAQHMYNFMYYRTPRLVRRRHTVGIPARVNYKGEVIKDLDEDTLKLAGKYLVEQEGVGSIGVSFLHAYLNPEHERRAAEILSEMYPNVSISISSEVVSEYREYERTSTTVLDAYIKPILSSYVLKLEESLSNRGFRGILLIMRSDGGVMTASRAAKSPISTVASGPAGGVVGACYYSKSLQKNRIISMDIGGTSLDVCVIEDGFANVIHQTSLEHYPLLSTMYDIRSIGAGGGSIASVQGGLLKVGPESAGADPGPMCYGKGGTRPTVTDAAVCLGYIDPSGFLSGEMPLKLELAVEGIEHQIAEPLRVSLIEGASGIIKVTTTNSIGAIRQITLEEGRDPADFSLMSFGGAGPLFAAILARELKIPEAVVPNGPAAFSAWGMLMSDITCEISQTYISLLDEISWDSLLARFIPLQSKVVSILIEQNVPKSSVSVQKKLELRYLGQEHALELQIDDRSSVHDIREGFDELHLKRYGHKMKDPVQIVGLRARGIGVLPKPSLPRLSGLKSYGGRAELGKRQAFCLVLDDMTDFTVYRRDKLSEGDHVDGPAIIDEGVCTTVIHTGQKLTVDEFGNLSIRT